MDNEHAVVNQCWYCIRTFSTPAHRSRHMSASHPEESRLLPPAGWVQDGASVPAVPVGRSVRSEEGNETDSQDCTSGDDGNMAVGGAEPRNEDEDGIGPVVGSGSGDRTHDGMERGTISSAVLPLPTATGSVSARIAAFYGKYPEAGMAMPVTYPTDALLPTFFDTDALQKLLRFIVTSGGTGLSQVDQQALGDVLLALEPDLRPIGDVNSLHDRLSSSHALVTAVRVEERRILAQRSWQQVTMDVGRVVHLLLS